MVNKVVFESKKAIILGGLLTALILCVTPVYKLITVILDIILKSIPEQSKSLMEWVKIFSSNAESVAKLKEAKPQLVLIGSIRVCLVLFDGKLYALDDKCSHNGESLSKGIVNYLGEIVCPWHSYRFKLNSGREAGERSEDMKTYTLKEDENGLYIFI